MSGRPLSARRGAGPRLGGTDEAYLLLESAVGVEAPMQVVVVLGDDPGVDVVADLVAALATGPLERAVRRPVVPWARPGWVRPPGTARARIDTEPVDGVGEWAQAHLMAAPIDVVGARGWQVASAPVVGGGRVVSIVASHVVADGRRFLETIAAAVGGSGERSDPFAAAPSRVRAVLDDLVDVAVAAVDAARAARELGSTRSASAAARPKRPPREPSGDAGAVAHHTVVVDRDCWHAVAREQGGTATTLLVAFGAGLAARSGVVAARGGADGPVRLALAVDRRAAGDTTTANTAAGITIDLQPDHLHPDPVNPVDTDRAGGLADTRTRIREALARPAGDDAVARIARLLPRRVLGRVVAGIPGPDVSVSHLGPAPEGLLTWRGSRARGVMVRAAARHAAPGLAETMLPGLALWGVEYDDAITLTVCAADPVARADVADTVEGELARWGLEVSGSL